MLLQLVPPHSVYRIFLENLVHKVVELRREVPHNWDLLHSNLMNQVLESIRVEWRLARRQLDEDAAQRPEVRLIAVNAAVLEQFWRHVVGRA